ERATASAANGLAATAAPVSLRGVSVAIQSETEASPLTPEAAAIRVIDADANSLRGLLRVFPADGAPLKATGGEPATFVWTLPGRSSDRVIGDLRSALLVSYAGIDGLPHTDVVPAVVRLATTLSGIRLVASVRA